jgi:hypothetical protein
MDPADALPMSVLALRRTACMELCVVGILQSPVARSVLLSDTDV